MAKVPPKVSKTKNKPNPADRFPGPGPGRPKGSKDKIPRNLKDKILAIAEDLEKKGIGLNKQAEEDPKWFFEHFLKPMLPKDVKIDADSKLTVEIVRFSDADKAASK